ncbi:CocE/NonD family hydrolase [Embleya sp. NPDC005971]|uniref:CocE/NonD family hydrolase n=1 Tax=Embleya sp. NPDC005971 TaxID=3156724 RepID=UPI0033F58D86
MSSQEPQPTTLYPELDEAALARIAEALETGDTSHLAPARAAEIEQLRSRVDFRRVTVPRPPEGGSTKVSLDGALWAHRDGEARPVVVMPSPWTDAGWLVYVAQAIRFALKGYDVLAYTARGFAGSGGHVEVAGTPDIEDGIAALDFAIEQIGTEPTSVGFLGDSYGSGISQLVAAHEPRVKAVAALSTWGDLGKAFYENDTRHVASVAALLKAAAKARLSEKTQQVFADVLNNENVPDTLAWAVPRSPITYIEQINDNDVAVLFANAWHETLFPSNQMLETFNRLTGPKRLLMSIGDHSGPEATGIVGLPNRIWEDAHRWFDHHLKGVDNDIDTEGEVVSEIMWHGPIEERSTWGAVTGRTERLYLSAPQNGGDGTLTDKPSGDGDVTFRAGTDTRATVADAIIFSGFAELAGLPRVYRTGKIDRANAGVWVTAPLPVVTPLRGIPRLHLTYTVDAPESTLVAYLFAVGPRGLGHIITHAPFTRLLGEAGESVTVDIELQATGYNVPAGHRVMLVVDTIDPFYGAATVEGSTITIAPTESDPHHLDLPLG